MRAGSTRTGPAGTRVGYTPAIPLHEPGPAGALLDAALTPPAMTPPASPSSSADPLAWWLNAWLAVLVTFFTVAGLGLAWKQAASRQAEGAAERALMDPAAPDPGMTASEPVSSTSARQVTIGIYLERITALSIRDSRFEVVCDVWFSWSGADLDPVDRLVVVDGTIDTLDLLDESHDGDRHYRRYELKAEITKPFRIDHFPIDRHLLLLAFENGAMLRDELVLVPDHVNTAVSSRAAVHGYRLERLEAIEKAHSYKTSRGEPGILPGAKTTFSQARFGIVITRDGWGLFLKMFQALFVAVAIALLPCFIRPTDVDPRFGLGVGALFAAVANAYLVDTYVPDTGEFALADMINLLGTVTILLTLVESTLSLHLYDHRDERSLSLRLDRVSFVVTLTGFVAALALMLIGAAATR